MRLKRILPAALILILSVVAGCRFHSKEAEIKGSGNRQTIKREAAPFTAVSSHGAFDIEVTCQKEQSIELEGDDNILPVISTEVKNGVLHLRSTKGFSDQNGVRVRVNVPNLESISLEGAGEVLVQDVKNEKFHVDASGAGVISVTGQTTALSIKASGAGKVLTNRLRADRVDVNANGAVSVEVDVIKQLDVVVSGPSHVVYEGDPEINQTINGPGSVERKERKGAQ